MLQEPQHVVEPSPCPPPRSHGPALERPRVEHSAALRVREERPTCRQLATQHALAQQDRQDRLLRRVEKGERVGIRIGERTDDHRLRAPVQPVVHDALHLLGATHQDAVDTYAGCVRHIERVGVHQLQRVILAVVPYALPHGILQRDEDVGPTGFEQRGTHVWQVLDALLVVGILPNVCVHEQQHLPGLKLRQRLADHKRLPGIVAQFTGVGQQLHTRLLLFRLLGQAVPPVVVIVGQLPLSVGHEVHAPCLEEPPEFVGYLPEGRTVVMRRALRVERDHGQCRRHHRGGKLEPE
mmetsp:Transcript_109081/g.326258  ORF Transcript_109081/g.326258 Transcript_109081/m.326258 type:complete len:295 (-) Transcript_109081:2-886(-)